MTTIRGRTDVWVAVALAAGLLIVYNANGREIGSFDSQPTKFAARELLVRRTLALNHVVGAVPQYAERAAFVLSPDGRYRSAYSPMPAILAAAIAYPLAKMRLLDVRAAHAPSLIAVLGASLLTALAVAVLYFTARQWVDRARAIALAVGLGLGTGLWPLVSRTLWAHETAIFGLAVAIAAFCSSHDRLRSGAVVWVAAGLSLAGVARPQLAPTIAVLLLGICARAPRREAAVAVALVGVSAASLMFVNWRWFGEPLGAVALMGETNDAVHRTRGWIDWSFPGLPGLLLSPSRGLLIFSPIVAVALAGFADARRAPWGSPLPWCAAAAIAQFILYGGYAVWWAGHTYGPRYMLDVLPALVPLAAAALVRVRLSSAAAALCGVALAWSIAMSATGAFFYPHDEWNTSPVSVDRDHGRLWDWSDPQFVRCWRSGPSPQNFQLFQSIASRR